MSWIPELINHVCKWIGAKVLEDIEIHQNFQNNPQPMDEEFCCASLLGYFPAIKLCCHYCQALHSDHLGHVGDLRGGPVPGVHQHRVVWLLPPAWLAPVHLRQPVGGGPGSLVPANDDSSISPPAIEDRGQALSLEKQQERLTFCVWSLDPLWTAREAASRPWAPDSGQSDRPCPGTWTPPRRGTRPGGQWRGPAGPAAGSSSACNTSAAMTPHSASCHEAPWLDWPSWRSRRSWNHEMTQDSLTGGVLRLCDYVPVWLGAAHVVWDEELQGHAHHNDSEL